MTDRDRVIAEEIRARIRAPRFEPYRVVLKNGQRFEVPDSAFGALYGDTTLVGYDYSPVDGIPEHLATIPVADIDRVETVAGRAEPAAAR